MITQEEYLKNPCSVSSIPYWKAKSITIPDGMKILHQDEYDRDYWLYTIAKENLS